MEIFTAAVCIIVLLASTTTGHSIVNKKIVEKQKNDKSDYSTPDTILFTNEKKGALKFETDIILTNEQKKQLNVESDVTGNVITPQAVYRSTNYLWKDDIIPYTIAPGTNATNFMKAIEHWESKTCLKFVPRTNQDDYIELIDTKGCSSYVGCAKQGKQHISLDKRCSIGAAIHELGHVIGFWHEQSRPDRDQYVEIVWANIVPGYSFNFMKHTTDTIDSLNITYDYYSIMHYSQYSFSSNGEVTFTIKQNIDYERVGNSNELSTLDIEQANLLYNCSSKTKSSVKFALSPPTQVITFALYNKAIDKCIVAREIKHGYTLSDPINTKFEAILSSECDKENAKWSIDNNEHLVHFNTKLCLSSTKSGRFVLKNCLTPNNDWRMKWSCDKHFIIQPRSGLCLSVKQHVTSNSLMKELNNMFLQPPIDRNDDTLQLKFCNLTNKHQFFALIKTSDKEETNNNGSSFCQLFKNYQATNCYVENKRNTEGWMRCKRYGHFVTGFKFISGTSFVNSLVCCKPDSSSNMVASSYLLSPPGTCFHRPWWTSVGLSMFQCHSGEYLHGIRFVHQYSIGQVECCKIKGRNVFNYSHCEKILQYPSCLNGNHKGTFITRYSNNCVGSWGTHECSKEIECCY